MNAIVSALSSFIASFTPAQSATVALALAAIIVSIVGLVQRAQQNPRVDLQFEWRPGLLKSDKFPQQGVVVAIANDGLAPARRVRIIAKGIGTGHGAPHIEYSELAPGVEEFATVPVREGNRVKLIISYSHRRRPLVRRGPRKVWDEGTQKWFKL